MSLCNNLNFVKTIWFNILNVFYHTLTKSLENNVLQNKFNDRALLSNLYWYILSEWILWKPLKGLSNAVHTI